MEFDVRPSEAENRSYRAGLILLAILIVAVLVLQFTGNRLSQGPESVASNDRAQFLRSGDIYAKLQVAWPYRQFADYAVASYERAVPSPAAYRRLGVLKLALGEPGLADLRKIDSAEARRGLDLDKKEVAKLHRERRMWERVYGPGELTPAEARRYAATIRELNLEPLKESAVAQVYRKAGLAETAQRAMASARTRYRISLIAGGVLIVLLGMGGLAGLAIAGMFVVTTLPRLDPAPLTHIRPSALIRAFIVYLASYMGIGAILEMLSQTTGFDLRGDSASLLYTGVLIATGFGAYALGLSALVSRIRVGENWREIGYRTVSAGRDVLWGVMGYCAAMPLVTAAAAQSLMVSRTLLRQFPTPEQPFGGMISNGGALEIVLVFFAASVMAPIVEETFFRGMLYTAFRGRLGIGPAVVLTSAIFAVIHPLPGGFLPIFALACVLALLRERSGSLLPCIVCHSVFNTVSLLMVSLLT